MTERLLSREKSRRAAFTFCVTTDCQVYGGMDSEAATTNKAIDATKGEVIVYLNQPNNIFTLYEYLCFNDEVLLMLFINA